MKKSLVSRLIVSAMCVLFCYGVGICKNNAQAQKSGGADAKTEAATGEQTSKETAKQLKDANALIAKQTKQIDDQAKQIETQKTRIDELTKLNDEQKKRIDELTKQVNEQTKRIDEQTKRVNEQSDLNARIKKENEDFRTESAKNKKEIADLSRKNAELEQTAAVNRQTIDSLTKERDRFRQQSEQDRRKMSEIAAYYNEAASFDELIKNSSKHSITRDTAFVEKNSKEGKVLNDLFTYFKAKALLEKPYNAAGVSGALEGLNKIKRNSELTDALKDRVEGYKECGEALRKAADDIIELDKKERALGIPEANDEKFRKISAILCRYMYDYYTYAESPFLSGIVSQIIKIKGIDADRDIKDLRNKLK